ncbi:MAG: methylamine utilization protein [Pseudomonadota bacterium]
MTIKLKTLLASLVAISFVGAAQSEKLTVKVTDHRGAPIAGAVISFTPVVRADNAQSPQGDIVVRQKDLQFQPFTTLAPIGSEITFKNEDDVLHHVFSFSKTKRFNLTLFGRDEPQSVTFENTGIVTVGCNIHDGMIAHIFISDAPFAGQTNEDGMIEITGIPAGDGQLVVWHPLMRQRDNRVLQEIVLTDSSPEILITSKFRSGIRRSSDY